MPGSPLSDVSLSQWVLFALCCDLTGQVLEWDKTLPCIRDTATTGQAVLEASHGQGQLVLLSSCGSVMAEVLSNQGNSCSNIARQCSQVLDFSLLPLQRTLQQLLSTAVICSVVLSMLSATRCWIKL